MLSYLPILCGIYFLNELSKRNNVIIAVSEGIRDKDGNYITSGKAMADTFGHQQLSGAGKALEFIVKENIETSNFDMKRSNLFKIKK